MVIMEPAPPRSLRPNQRRADSGSLSVTQGDTQTLTLLCMRAPFTPARSSAAAATSTGPARSVAARDAQPPGPNDVEPAGRRPCVVACGDWSSQNSEASCSLPMLSSACSVCLGCRNVLPRLTAEVLRALYLTIRHLLDPRPSAESR